MGDKNTIDSILGAARSELRSLGIGGFRSRAVAKAAKVSLGTLTHYFPTKEDLLESVAVTFLKSSRGHWTKRADGIGEHGLEPIVIGFYRLCRRHQYIVRLIVHLSARDGAIWGVGTARIVGPLLDDVEERLGHDKRLLALSVISMSMVYALYTDEELRAFTGSASAGSAHEEVIEHLLRLSRA